MNSVSEGILILPLYNSEFYHQDKMLTVHDVDVFLQARMYYKVKKGNKQG